MTLVPPLSKPTSTAISAASHNSTSIAPMTGYSLARWNRAHKHAEPPGIASRSKATNREKGPSRQICKSLRCNCPPNPAQLTIGQTGYPSR